jgi:tetratricopeptide (TPR) repeat protein
MNKKEYLQYALYALRNPGLAKKIYDLRNNLKSWDLGKNFNPTLLPHNLPSKVINKIALSLYLHGQFDDALKILRWKGDSSSSMTEGWLLLYLGENEKARKLFSALVNRAPKRIEALKNLAYVDYLENRLDDAVKLLQDAICLDASIVPPVTLLSRIIKDRSYLEYITKNYHSQSKRGFSSRSYAQLIRACVRCQATDIAEKIVEDAIINIQIKGEKNKPTKVATGMPKGQYTNEKGNIILDQFSEVMENHGIQYFLMGGTLLGLIRDNKLLPWDKDLDFGCFSEEATASNLWDIFMKSPFFLPMGTTDERLIKLRHITGVTVDIFVNHRDGNSMWHGGQFVSWCDKPFKLSTVDFEGMTLYIPDNPEEYLENHYGESWRKPDPLFDVFWEAPNIYHVDKDKRYISTLAKSVDMLSTNSTKEFSTRLERAKRSCVEDVTSAYQLAIKTYNEFTRG